LRRTDGRRPLHERGEELLRAKEAHLARLRMESEAANPELTFAPRISARSRTIAADKLRGAGLPVAGSSAAGAVAATSDIVPERQWVGGAAAASAASAHAVVHASVAATERLTRDAAMAQLRRAARAEAAAHAEAERHTFAPRIDPHAGNRYRDRLLAMGIPATHVDAMSFLQRQELWAQLHEERQAAAARGELSRVGCTFSPDVGNADEVLAVARPAAVLETAADRVQRLAVEEVERRRASRQAAAAAAASQFDFKPAINAVSRQIGRAHTVEEHVSNERAKRARMAAAAAAEADFRAAHTFHPTLVAAPHGPAFPAADGAGEGDGGGTAFRLAAAADPAGLGERIEAHLRDKAQRLEVARRAAEYEQLRECTFHPATNAPTAAQRRVDAGGDDAVPTVVVVRGLGKFLEMKELARRMEEEKRCARVRACCTREYICHCQLRRAHVPSSAGGGRRRLLR